MTCCVTFCYCRNQLICFIYRKLFTVTIWNCLWHCGRYSSADWNKFISQDRDLCQPLNGLTVCLSLNSSDRICAPTGWAGDVIRKALNRTQTALSSLFESIELKLRRTSTHDTHHHRRDSFAGPAGNHSHGYRQRRRRQRRQQRDDDRSVTTICLVWSMLLNCALSWPALFYLQSQHC